MILVQNRQLQSNGNKVLAFILILFLFSSCGIFSSSGSSDSSNSGNKDSRNEVKVDTVEWTQVPEKDFPPINNVDEEIIEKEVKRPKEKKDSYNVTSFMPFESSRINYGAEYPSDIRNLKYLQYYAGMKIAIEQLEKEDIKLNLSVYDSKQDLTKVKSILNNNVDNTTDVILGSLKKDILIELANFGKENSIPVISPWYSSQSVADKNEYYVQLTPFLIDHYHALASHALSHFDAEDIYLVGRNGSKDPSRFKYFQEEAFNVTGEKEVLNEFVIDIDSLSAEYGIFRSLIENRKENLKTNKPIVFIIPNFSMREANYIYDLIRRMNVERLGQEVYVYGMPVLYSMDKITYDYYTNLNIRIAMSRYTKKSSPEARNFAATFFREYNDYPLDDAYEGYDNMLWLGRMLDKYGGGFIDNLDKDDREYLSTKFNIQSVMDGDVEKKELDYFENENLRIIQFFENEFSIVK